MPIRLMAVVQMAKRQLLVKTLKVVESSTRKIAQLHTSDVALMGLQLVIA